MKIYDFRFKNGITLIALIITIIVLLILTGVSLSALVGDNGIINQATKAKKNSEVEREKEQIAFAINSSYGNDGIDTSVIDKVALEKNLEKSIGENKVKLIADIEDEEVFYIKFIDSNRYYEIDADRNMTLIEVTGGEKNLKLTCVNSSNIVLLEKTYLVLKNQYSKTLPKIEGYTPEQEKISGTITTDEEITVMYYWTIPEEQLIFTGLDASGNITTDESKIVSYMLGTGTTTNGNGIKANPTVLSALKIPEIYNGKNVIKIGQFAFRGINNIATILFSNNVNTIGKYSFASCSNLKTLTINNNITLIEMAAFSGCTNLKKVIYNSEKNLFSSYATIFNACTNWAEIEVNSDNKTFKVVDNVLYSKDGSKIIRVPTGYSGSFTTKEGVTVISENSFSYCPNVTSIIIKDEVTIIEGQAFIGCSGIIDLTIGKGVNSIGDWSFGRCTNLKKIVYNNEKNLFLTNGSIFNECNNWTEIEVNSDNTVFKVVDNVLYSKDGSKIIKAPTGYSGSFATKEGVTTISKNSFSNCPNITSVIINDEVTIIEGQAFIGCSGIIDLTIGKGVNSIGDWSFGRCTNLKKVVYNNEKNLFSTNGSIFNECNNWTEIEVNSDNTVFKVVDNVLYSKDGSKIIKVPTGYSGSFTIKEGVTTVLKYSFCYCPNITSVIINDEVTTIEGHAFVGCSRLINLTIGRGVNSIEDWAFYQCSNLKKIIYNNSYELLNSSSNIFASCNNWTEIEINSDNKVFKVVDNVLYTKDGSQIVRVPTGYNGIFSINSSVTIIGQNAFSRCANITSVILSSNITTIKASAFNNCTKLSSIIIPNSVVTIENLAFGNCTNLKIVIIDSSTVATGLTTQTGMGYLINVATTVYTKTTPGAYVTTNFNVVTSDKSGYTKYVKKVK